MNRRDRRRANRRREDSSAKRIRALEHRVETSGLPGRIHGLTDACRDCHATGELILLPGQKIVGRIFHDNTCPALAGAVDWRPVPP